MKDIFIVGLKSDTIWALSKVDYAVRGHNRLLCCTKTCYV